MAASTDLEVDGWRAAMLRAWTRDGSGSGLGGRQWHECGRGHKLILKVGVFEVEWRTMRVAAVLGEHQDGDDGGRGAPERRGQ